MSDADYVARFMRARIRKYDAALARSRQILSEMRDCIARTQAVLAQRQEPAPRMPFDWFHGYEDEPEGTAYTTPQDAPPEAGTPKNSTNS